MSKKTDKKDNIKRLVLLDAHAIIHRAYHALPEFSKSDGTPTGALYGLSTMLMKIIVDLKPDYLAACYDLPQKTFRHEAYENYKAGRVKADPALVEQLQNSRQIFEAFSIPIYDKAGFEADDMLGTIVEQLKKEKNIDIIIASGDMDTLQLVNDKKVRVFTLKKGLNDTILYDEDAVVARFSFTPKCIPDYKGLRGDPSDNIIGIAGIGEKTATTLVAHFGTIEKLYTSLKKGDTEVKSLGISDRVVALLKEGEEEARFSKVLATIRRDAPIEFTIPEKVWREQFDIEQVKKIFHTFEFRSLLPRIENLFKEKQVEEIEKEVLEKQEKEDPLADIEILQAGIAVWLLNSDLTAPTKSQILTETKSQTIAEAQEKLNKQLAGTKLEKVYREIELPIIPRIAEMREHGVLVDREELENFGRELSMMQQKLAEEIFAAAGKTFNPNSPKQLGEVLFDDLKLSLPGKRNQKRSTRADILDELAGAHPVVQKILEYREVQKLLSTYVAVIPLHLDSKNRLHATFLQHGTTTGRFSSLDPNVQNLPIKNELGKRLRRAFIASKGKVLLALDYSQIELRVLAILSGDEELTRIFNTKEDIHRTVAARVFKIDERQVTSEQRRAAKVINFGIIYGMGATALAKNLGTSRSEAEEYIAAYFATFRGAALYMEQMKQFAREHHFTETLFGRRRYFKDMNSRLPYLRAMAERMAGNAPIQGTATADIIKLAIRFAYEDLEKAQLIDDAALVLQVHDELVYEITESKKEKIQEIIANAMRDVLERSYLHLKNTVPLEVNAGVGSNLEEVK